MKYDRFETDTEIILLFCVSNIEVTIDKATKKFTINQVPNTFAKKHGINWDHLQAVVDIVRQIIEVLPTATEGGE